MKTGADFFIAGTYNIKGSFSNYYSFGKLLTPELKKISYDKKEVIKKLESIEKEYTIIKQVDQKKALEILLVREIKNIIKSLETINLEDNNLENDYKKYLKLLKKYKLTKITPKYYLINEWPKPYNKMRWSAAHFMGLKEKYQIEDGVYLSEKYLYQYEASRHLIHEMIHLAIMSNTKEEGQNDSRGLEEGICDVVGVLYLGSKILGNKISENLLLYSKFGHFKKQRFVDLYRENIRMALVLYENYGMEGLF